MGCNIIFPSNAKHCWVGASEIRSAPRHRGSVTMPGQPENTDRYTVKPGAEAGDWCVWDTQRDAPVFGAGELTEDRARTLARRLSEAYRREVTGQSKGGA